MQNELEVFSHLDVLFYTDNDIIMADTAEDLLYAFRDLSEYCKLWALHEY